MTIPLSHWIVFVIVCAFVAWLNGRRARVQTPATPSLPKGDIRPIAPARAPSALTPPEGNWCRCCGRRAPVGAMWCWDCLDHVDAEASTPMSATWYAQHGTHCPFLDLPAGSWVKPESPDVVPEGLGPGVMRRFHSDVSPVGQWRAVDRALFDECQRGITA